MLRVLMLPGLGNSGPDHWQSHWERLDPRCVRVHQDEWDAPYCHDWVTRLNAAMDKHAGHLVFAAHSSACALVAQWASGASAERLQRVQGALLVAPSDPENPHYPEGPVGFGPVPLLRLPFASIVVASTDDRYIDADRARHYADAWGSRFVLVPRAGHINAASGFGPWPEGYTLLNSLREPADIEA